MSLSTTCTSPKYRLLLNGLLLGVGWTAALTGYARIGATLLIVVSAIAGWGIAVRAWNALRVRHVSIELLITIAAAGALIIGEYIEAAAVTFLFQLGNYLETRSMRRTRSALENLLSTAPETALVVRGVDIVEVPAHAVQKDDVIRVRPGARVPVDGVVTGGFSTVNESPITGEPLPAEKSPGAAVYAGSVNNSGLLEVRATGVGAETTLARIVRRVEEAQETKVPLQRFIERFARWYTPAIIALSAAAFAWTSDIHLALTLLVIACPGALVIATPVAVTVGVGRAARRGMLVKGGSFLESMGRISAIVFDKTGTITEGRPRLVNVSAFATPEHARLAEACGRTGEEIGPAQEVLCWAALAEADASHPIGEPVIEAVRASGRLPQSDRSETIAGQGIRASWRGHEVVIGRAAWLRDQGHSIPQQAIAYEAGHQQDGHASALVAVDGEVIGAFAVADQVREEAPDTVRRLRRLGIERIIMASGDSEPAATAVSRNVGITETYARQMPEDKLALIHRLQAEGHVVAFVGDGINDAPALAAADIGIAMGAAGTDVAVEAADLALLTNDLRRIPEAVSLSRRTGGAIRQNLAIALVTVAVLLAGVLAGDVHMGMGMLVHQASLLVVVLNSMRLRAPKMSGATDANRSTTITTTKPQR